MDKRYDPKQHEEKIYKLWEKGGYFTPKIRAKKKPFTIMMPPPNVTGSLHIGHALTAAIEDALVRWHRMRGEPTLYLPGVDHAGIATQYVVEKGLKKEGKTRFDLGREKFLERIWEWVNKYGHVIDDQHKKLGVSADWRRRRFTMDEDYQKAVKEAFNRLYQKGLIYKGTRIINWCPRCGTAISDLENIHKEEEGTLYYLNYGPLQIATVRPETIFADIAVAVHPKDKRYKNLVGKKATIPLVGRKIPIIKDELVDKEFGTGALKITPAHDELDWQIWQKHKKEFQEVPVIISPEGLATGKKWLPKKYVGLSIADARKKVVEDLRAAGAITKEEKIKHSVGHCQRCDTLVEPLVSDQWFVKAKPLAEPAIKAVKDGTIKIIPKRFEKIYFHWMENIHDWTISRQLWWGHKIPIRGEEDVLDTWFSSSLWPFATLGWPKKTRDFEYFYPTTLLETGYDILFFWVARMIMMGYELTGQPPFTTVYLHGMIRDIEGRKMSKTLGNVLDPLKFIEKYGADALRMALVVGTTPGNDMKLSEEKIVGYRNFANKVWNIGRFVFANSAEIRNPNIEIRNSDDRWILKELKNSVKKITLSLERLRLSDAGHEIYNFIWHKFADVYIERVKERESGRVEGVRPDAIPVLYYVLETSLKLLHPFMPFVTEVIWQEARRQTAAKKFFKEKALIIARWPQ